MEIRNRTINQALLVFSIFASVTHVFYVIRSIQFGFSLNLILASLALLILILVTVRRKKLAVKTKIYLLSVIVLLTIVAGMNVLGFLAAAKYYIVIIPVFASFYVSFKRSLLLFILYFLIFITYGILYISGFLKVNIDTSLFITSFSPWFADAFAMVLTSLGLLYVGKNYGESLVSAYKEIKEHKDNLQKQVEDRTKELKEANKKLESTNCSLQESNTLLDEKNRTIKTQNEKLSEALENLKQTQAHLVQTEKMTSLGILTTGVAHEINNPLNYLMGAYKGLESYFEDFGSQNDEETSILLKCVYDGVERISSIVSGLNQFSQTNSKMDENCDLHAILGNCLIILKDQLEDKVKVIKDYSNKEIIIYGNRGRIHQLFMNILMNAKYAVTEEGIITIKTALDDNGIRIEIADNGCGISKENIDQITDPFFTTRKPGEGAGLGLSISNTIIKEHGGEMLFKSKENHGTIVIVQFPRRLM